MKEIPVSSTVEVVIKAVDEVVKPLLAIQDSLKITQGDFTQVQQELATFAYQLTALYDCFDKNSKFIAERNADLEELAKQFKQSFKNLEKVDEHIQWGIVSAARDLRDAAQEEIKFGIQSEVAPTIRDLQNAVNDNRDRLNTYKKMTWMMHAKFIGIAIACGIAIGMASFFWFTHKIKQLRCDCECVIKQEAPAVETSPLKPEKPAEKVQPKREERIQYNRPLKRR